MTIKEIQQEILRMKKEQDVCILAHAYQGQEILEVADYMGDSYGLSVQAAKSDCSGVIMCGVRFMAETCKVLSPDKKSGLQTRLQDVQWQSSLTWKAFANSRQSIRIMQLLPTLTQLLNSRQSATCA